MVRLKGKKRKANAEAERAFQFHYGTIKSSRSLPESKPLYYFNSTMVRLKALHVAIPPLIETFQFHYGTIKREKPNIFVPLPIVISIPLWYD